MEISDLLPIVVVGLVFTVSMFVLATQAKKQKGFQSPRPRFNLRALKLKIPWATLIISVGLLGYFVESNRNTSEFEEFTRRPEMRQLFIEGFAVLDEFCTKLAKHDAAAASICVRMRDLSDMRQALKKRDPIFPLDFNIFRKTVMSFLVYCQKSDREVCGSLATAKSFNSQKINADKIYREIGEKHERNRLKNENVTLRSLVFAQISHGSWSHLINNLLSLLIFGLFVESWLGPLVFSFVYIVAGTLSIFLYTKYLCPPGVEVLGASANISAIIGAYTLFRFTEWRRTEAQARGTEVGRISVPEVFWMGYFLFGDDIKGILDHRPGIAYGAHISGAVAGFILVWVYTKFFRKPSAVPVDVVS